MRERGSSILAGRYNLRRRLESQTSPSEVWLAEGPFDAEYLVRLWPYQGDDPPDVLRALWDCELRNLYRLTTTPAAEAALLQLRDAGLDRVSRCFLMALQGPGLEPLSSLFPQRAKTLWLSSRTPGGRLDLWRGLRRIAMGIRLLHEQGLLHRHLRATDVFVDASHGPASFRLGGFEWTIRMTPDGTTGIGPDPFVSDVTTNDVGFSPEWDWLLFGLLCGRCVLSAEHLEGKGVPERVAGLRAGLADRIELTPEEKNLLKGLLAPDQRTRLVRGWEIESRLCEIERALETAGRRTEPGRPFVLGFNPRSLDLATRCGEGGLKFLKNGSESPFNPNDPEHVGKLRDFLRDDLDGGQLIRPGASQQHMLVGRSLIVRVKPWSDSNGEGVEIPTWDVAYLQGAGELRGSDSFREDVDLPRGRLTVRTIGEIKRNPSVRTSASSWEAVLPRETVRTELPSELRRLHDFLRVTNQIELLIRDAEVFAYETVESRTNGGVRTLQVQEIDRKRTPYPAFRFDGGLANFLLREQAQVGKNLRIALSAIDDDGITTPWVRDADLFEAAVIDPDTQTVTLQRMEHGSGNSDIPRQGCLRTKGFFGQVSLIRRRKKAIDRLEEHAYLLRALLAPGQVALDTVDAVAEPQLDGDRVDLAKQAVIRDLLRTRPIYCLQGPPGTGKTTLVAHLLGEFFQDDPIGQVLVTAQAHSAVDVLRERVARELENKGRGVDSLVSIRLQTRNERAAGRAAGGDDVEAVALAVLRKSLSFVREVAVRSRAQEQWLSDAEAMSLDLATGALGRAAGEFRQLVKRGASITYCTTSEADLAELAELTQAFDWSIVEEAGRAHGFDLALPLQAGHRWLLIGDQRQLPPYRYEDYRTGLDSLDQVAEALERLPAAGGGLVDRDWIRAWKDTDGPDRETFKRFGVAWLHTFDAVYSGCRQAWGEERLTVEEANGALAGLLSGQHRMHPSIGRLVSETYYEGRIRDCTVNSAGEVLPRVRHDLAEPAPLRGKALVWVETPWCQAHTDEFAEEGPMQRRPRYSNPSESRLIRRLLSGLRRPSATERDPLSVAVLTPYMQQFRMLRAELRHAALDGQGFVWRKPLSGRGDAATSGTERVPGVYTVDSFQGNEADIVVVSLVRNNGRPSGSGLGFLSERSRMNVLMSRAERLLVLVGSFRFFDEQVKHVSAEDREAPLWHWWKLLREFERLESEGNAVRIPASDLLELDR